jgi:hypothetical protein
MDNNQPTAPPEKAKIEVTITVLPHREVAFQLSFYFPVKPAGDAR